MPERRDRDDDHNDDGGGLLPGRRDGDDDAGGGAAGAVHDGVVKAREDVTSVKKEPNDQGGQSRYHLRSRGPRSAHLCRISEAATAANRVANIIFPTTNTQTKSVDGGMEEMKGAGNPTVNFCDNSGLFLSGRITSPRVTQRTLTLLTMLYERERVLRGQIVPLYIACG